VRGDRREAGAASSGNGEPTPTGGGAPELVCPTGPAEAAEALTGGPDGPRVVVRGGATKLDWGAPVEGVERVVDTAGLDRLVRHDPSDLTATVQAGVPLQRLQAELAEAGQWLALDPPPGDAAGRTATVGGVLATADHGPRRLACGAPRDLVIGATFALADGTVARTGGNVIKNVAGFDLAKLLCGSLGTLALLIDVTVRLDPLPAATATLSAPATPGQAHALALALSDARLEPAAIDHTGQATGHDPGRVWVRFAARDAAVAAQRRAAAADVAARHGLSTEPVDDDEGLWADLVAGLAGGDDETVVAVTTLPSLSAQVAEAVSAGAAAADVAARWHSHVALGLHRVALSGAAPSEHAAVVRALRAAGFRAELRRRVAGVDDHVDAWVDGELPSAWPLMRSVKHRLDPHRRFAPGRFFGGL
jgi:glycolate oxidase FAD binding subunit